jgi:hypothetical protein
MEARAAETGPERCAPAERFAGDDPALRPPGERFTAEDEDEDDSCLREPTLGEAVLAEPACLDGVEWRSTRAPMAVVASATASETRSADASAAAKAMAADGICPLAPLATLATAAPPPGARSVGPDVAPRRLAMPVPSALS